MRSYYKNKKSSSFDPQSKEPFKISRSKIDLFIECPRCFYLDRRLGVRRPDSFPFTLNNAVDTLLKKEFDMYRAQGVTHPLMETYGIDALPYADKRLEEWRDARVRGIQHHHKETNLIIHGGIDDVWVNPKGECIIVDYKATSKNTEVTIDAPWQDSYKRQMEVYQWLFRQNGFPVSSTGYFVYVNGRTDVEAFDGKLEFDVTIIPYKGSDSWVPKVLSQIKTCLVDERVPSKGERCEYCPYRENAGKALQERYKKLTESNNSTSKRREGTRTLF